jgi:hypothetical protein
LRNPLRIGALLLGLGLLGFEVATIVISLLGPAVSQQYRAVYLAHRQLCWLSPAEQAEAAADPYLAGLPDDAEIAHLDHRTLCMLLPDWPPAPHRTRDGGIFSQRERMEIMLPVHPGQSSAALTVEGYAPPRIARRAAGTEIEIEPIVDGIAQPPAMLAIGETKAFGISLPRTETTRIVRVTLIIPQPRWLQALNDSDDPQYLGLVLRRIDRRQLICGVSSPRLLNDFRSTADARHGHQPAPQG